MQRKKFVKLAALGSAIALCLPGAATTMAGPPVDGAAADDVAVGLGHYYYPFSPMPGVEAAFPHMALIEDVNAQGIRTPEVWMSFTQGPDSVHNTVPPGVLVSHDGAKTFVDRRDDTLLNTTTMMRLDNGHYIAPDFVPEWTDSGPVVVTRLSRDRGKTWSVVKGHITPPAGKTFTNVKFDKGIRLHKNAMQLPDGRVLVGAYGMFGEDQRWSAMILSTTDEGTTWSVWGVINASNAVGASEPTFSRTRDGRLIAILRGSPESAGLMQSYSSDDGKTWTEPVRVQAPTDTVKAAVEPSLVLQPNGVLVFAYGRPASHLLISKSGNGDDWGNYQLLFDNAPQPNGEKVWGTSANMTTVPLDGNRTLVASDTCAPWGCMPYNQTYAVWARTVDAVTPGVGKLDLQTLVATGKATITADVETNKLFAETRKEGAVDGSASPHAAAILKPGTSFILELDKAYTINKIGLLMAPGIVQSANVQLSANGKAWGKPKVKAHNRKDYALNYTTIEPTDAKFIKISPEGKAPLAITELEVYSADTDTFENDPINQPPRGWVYTTHAEVVDVKPHSGKVQYTGSDSRRALRLLDFDTTAQAKARRLFTARESVAIDYDMSSVYQSGGTLLTIGGTNADGKSIEPYHFHIEVPSRVVRQYDGKKWHDIGKLSAPIRTHEWTKVSFKADVKGGTLAIGGQTFTLRPPNGAPTALNAVTFASMGTKPKGSAFYFDNVRITNPDQGSPELGRVNSLERDPNPVEHDVVIAQAEEGRRFHFPGAVKLEDGTILVVTRDGTSHIDDSGRVQLVRSSDNGKTWTKPTTIWDSPGDDRDPKISVSSTGRVFVTFFTAMKDSSGKTTRDTYVMHSDDKGATWSKPAQVGSSMAWVAEHGEVTEMPDGSLLAPIYGPGHSGVVRSTDGGLTFPAANETLFDTGGYGTSEVTLTVLPSGQVTAWLRGGEGKKSVVMRSSDSGHTWSGPEFSEMRQSSADAIVLPDGQLMVAYGDRSQRYGQRRITVGALIDNPDQPWNPEVTIPLYDSMVGDQANPALVQLDDSSVLVVGYSYNARQVVGTVVDIADFKRAPSDGDQLRRAIDLAAMVKDGRATIDTDLRSTTTPPSTTGPIGALDGKLGLGTAAMGSSQQIDSAYFTLTFQDTVRAGEIGVALRPGENQGATVEYRDADSVWHLVASLDHAWRYGDVDWIKLLHKQSITGIRVLATTSKAQRPPNSGSKPLPVAITEIAVR